MMEKMDERLDKMNEKLMADARDFGWSTTSRIMSLQLLKKVSLKVSGKKMAV